MNADQTGIFTIRHTQCVFFLVQGEAVRNVERPGMNIQQFAIGVEFENPLVAITVRDEEDARRRDGHISRLAEMFITRPGDKGLAQC